ncbi:MAG: hypothetical protein OXG78_02105, partial [Chloroflexi bacterium]|nr:hypothetical protein [Chloroflexota bacterium]
MNVYRLSQYFALMLMALLISSHLPAAAAEHVIELTASCSLYDAIVAANSDSEAGGCPAGRGADTIRLTSDITLDRGLPAIVSTVTIEGEGYTISGDGSHRILQVVEATVSVRNLTLVDGYSSGSGGALSVAQSSQVQIHNSRFLRNEAAENGGAIMVWGLSSLNIKGSSFRENASGNSVPHSGYGGAISADVAKEIRIESSSFVNNRARSNGGAIGFVTSDLLDVRNSTFSGNRADAIGGAVYLNFDSNEMKPGVNEHLDATFIHVTMVNNVAADHGGGIWQSYTIEPDGALTLINSLLAGNRRGDCVTPLDVNISNFIADRSCDPAISGEPDIAELHGSLAYYSLLETSQAIKAGAAEYCVARDQLGNDRPAAGPCDIGAIESAWTAPKPHPPMHTCTLRQQILAANLDAAVGSCPAGNGVDTIEFVSDVSLRSPLPAITSHIIFEGNGYTLDGDDTLPLFSVAGGSIEINHLTMTRCYSPKGGGAVRVKAGIAYIPHTLIRDCSAMGIGGAIHNSSGGIVKIADSVVNGRQAPNDGVIFNQGSLRIIRSRLTGYRVEPTYLSGSVIFNDYGRTTLIDSSIVGNSAGWGGAIQSWYGAINLIDSVIADNVASGYGGAMNIFSSAVRITGSRILRNACDFRGGAISLSGGRLTLRDSVLKDNVSAWSTGAIAIDDNPTVSIHRSVLADNRAVLGGGAISVSASFMERQTSVSITESIISGNVAEFGGAINAHGITSLSRKRAMVKIDISDSVISHN